MAREHWMDDVTNRVAARMKAMIPGIAASMVDAVPFGGTPPPKPKADLQGFLQASPQERQQFLQSIPPDQYQKVVGGLMSEAQRKFGPMAAKLMPLFHGDESVLSLQELSAQSAQPNLGMAQAAAQLQDMLGVALAPPKA